MNYYFWSALTVGFLGSFHCLGMCGPLALAVGSGTGNKSIVAKLLYNGGRLLTYTSMGALAGLIGSSFSMMGIQDDISILSGILIILVVLFSNDKLARMISGRTVTFTSGLRTALGQQLKKKSSFAITGIGMLNGLLPCGFVYLALAGATAADSAAEGATYMLLFGAGTVPMMLGLSMAGAFLSAKFRSGLNRLSPYVAIALAILLIYRGSQVKTTKDCCKRPHQSAYVPQ